MILIAMPDWWWLSVDLAIILVLFGGVRQFRALKSARTGNLTAALALSCAAGAVLSRHPVLEPGLVVSAVLIGALAGSFVAVRVNMVQVAAMVAFQHGAGGVAAFLVSFVEFTRDAASLTAVGRLAGILGMTVGAATFSGSMVAGGKLADWLKTAPVLLPKHSTVLLVLAALTLALGFLGGSSTGPALPWALLALALVSVLLGIVFSIRIGGADMPVLISFLNATAGFAAAFCGIIVQSRPLIACGATVASSGSVLTYFMCKAMNRSLVGVFAGVRGVSAPGSAPLPAFKERKERDPFSRAVEALKNAKKIVVIPGYGMAQAHAQSEVVQLAGALAQMGKEVKFAIHPVAGRMPGHMHVLLAEAAVDPDTLFDLEEINNDFRNTDVALIVGACDVVNPAAITRSGTPISGMPILMAHEARCAVVCNLDERPGYSGVENPLYAAANTVFLAGDAKLTTSSLLNALRAAPGSAI